MDKKILKTVYFVRHGKTDGNAAGKSQTPDIPLSDEGRRQARNLAERFSRIRFDAIIASPYTRAKETAEAIGDRTNKKVSFDDIFRELKRPSEILGVSYHEPEYHRIIADVEKTELDPEARYADEETLYEMEARARTALEMLLRRNEKTIVVVTHDVFLKMMMSAMMIADTDLAVKAFRDLRYFMTADNTSMTLVEYCEEPRGGVRWRLRAWNDREHLG